jgi:hypothetical protein
MSSTRLYGSDQETTTFEFNRMAVGSTGVTAIDTTRNLSPSTGGEFVQNAGRIYFASGHVMDGETRTLLGRFPLPVPGGNAVAVDPENEAVWFVKGQDANWSLLSYDINTFALRSSTPMIGLSGNPSSLVRFGTDGLAFRTTGGQVFLARPGVDSVPPVLQLPGPITVDADRPAGAIVSYTVTATDNQAPQPTVRCNPPSGTLFPIGRSSIVCTATDAAGNVTSGEVPVFVKGARDQLTDLMASLRGVPMSANMQLSLSTDLRNALIAASSAQPTGACTPLDSFTTKVGQEAGSAIASAPAATMITSARRIHVVLSCPTGP